MVFSHWTIIHCLFTYMNCMYRSQLHIWRVWRYQRCHQNAYMEEEQMMKRKGAKGETTIYNPYTYIYHDTHLILYIMTHVLWCKIYDISYATKCIYIYHTIISYVIYYMTHVLCYILYDTCFMLYIIWHMFYVLYLRSTHSSE